MAGVNESNGRIKVSISQLVGWGVILATLLGQWADLRVQITRVEDKLERHSERIAALENRNANVGFTRGDAERLREEIMSEVKQVRRR